MNVEQLGAGVTKRATTLADGRELIYYDDPGSLLGPDRAVDERVLDPRPETATMRQDVLTGDWITYATKRQNRVLMPSADADPLAPQSPKNPSEVPSNYDVAVFENRSPAFGPGLATDTDELTPPGPPTGLDDLKPMGLGQERSSIGRCEVVCFSPDAEGSFGTQSYTRARTIIEAWADRAAALSAMPGVEQVFIFENRGEEIGVSLPHPHGQIYAYPYVTPRTQRLLEQVAVPFASPPHLVNGLGAEPNLMARTLAKEQAGPRVVLAGEHFTAYVPFAARWPLEVHLMPHRHVPDFTGLTAEERDELAVMYLRILRGIDALYDTPTPYIAGWHQAPVNVGRDDVRLRLEITSPRRAADKIKYLAGSEAAMGAWTAEVLPEDAAARLREAIAMIPEVTA